MVKRLVILLAVWLTSVVGAMAYEPVATTLTHIFSPGFMSLQTKVNGNDLMPPIIMLGSDDVLSIGFDELASDRRYMRYELIHCSATWQPDALLPSEYVDGFNEAEVEIYDFSQATTVQYVHYEIEVPNPQMQIKLSGNYLLRIYDESDPSATLLQVRFQVAEPLMKAAASVTSRTDIDYNNAHQQLTVEVDTRGMQLNNVMNDVIVSVTQNSRPDMTVNLTHPTRIAGQVAIWEHVPQLIFPAGNEYRRFETVSTTYPGMGIDMMEFHDPYYHALLKTEYERASEPYQYDRTQHGRFRIRSSDTDYSDTEADYIMTHFTLDIPELKGVDLFIDGDLTNRSFSPESMMVYNRATNRYEASLLLKQGSYNYQYLAVPSGSSKGSASQVEGDKYQTRNEYTVCVFLRLPGQRYDRLVAVTSVTAEI